MGEPQIPHFYDFGIFGCVPEPQNQIFLYLETPGHLTKQQVIFVNLEILEIERFDNFRKTG